MRSVPVSVRTAVIETPTGPVEYSEAGAGQPVLYFHGTGAANDLVFAVERVLVDDGFRLIAPNRPGYGNTPVSCGRSSAACADLAARLLDHLGVEAAAVMGCSGGGLFAARFAERYPGKSRCLVLGCAQTHRWDAPAWLPEHSRWTFPLLVRPVCRKPLLAVYRWQLKFATPAGLLKLEAGRRVDEAWNDPAAIEFSRLTLYSMRRCLKRPAGFDNDFDILLGEDLLRRGVVQCPTLVIHDPMDPLAPAEHRDWTMECIPHAECCDVHAVGHLIWLGPGADAMYHQRTEFLRRHLGSRPGPNHELQPTGAV